MQIAKFTIGRVLWRAACAFLLSLPLSFLALEFGYMAIHGAAPLLFLIAPFFIFVEQGRAGLASIDVFAYFALQWIYYLVVIYFFSMLIERIRAQSEQ